MKKTVVGMVAAALMLATALATPALGDQDLSNTKVSGDTQVDAQIVDSAGEVAYIVTVPEKIDFGNLTCPANDEDSFVIQKFDVTCVQMQGVSKIQVSVHNDGATAGEANQDFFLTNKTNASCTFKPSYEVYAGTTKINTSEVMSANGYDYLVFTQEGQSVTGGVRLNQRQLYSYKDDIASIAGEYSGTIVFTTAVPAAA